MTARSSLAYRPDIDGLRAIAVTSVIAYHAFPELVPGGFVGVDIFFVISGYLITSILLDEMTDGRFSLLGFYARRMRRLFPALLLVLAATLGFGWYYLLPHEFAELGKHVAAGAAYVINIVLKFESGYFDAAAETKPLLHLWSLAIEEQFYAAWPLALLLLARTKYLVAGIAAAALLSLTLGILATSSDSTAAFYMPQNRVWELFLGALLAAAGQDSNARPQAVTAHRSRLSAGSREAIAHAVSAIGAALIAGAVFAFNREMPFPGYWALVPTLGAAGLIVAGGQALVNRLLLALPIMVFIGLVSYPLYLWHWPLLSLTAIIGAPDSVPLRLSLIGVAMVLSIGTYYAVERPLRTHRSPHMPLTLFGASIVLGLAGLVTMQLMIPPRLDQPRYRDIGVAIADWRFPDGFEKVERGGLTVNVAGRGPKHILFIGDSQMEQFAPRILRLVSDPASEWTASFATYGGCPPIPGFDRVRRGVVDRQCADFTAKTMAFAKDTSINRVVLAAMWRSHLQERPSRDEATAAAGRSEQVRKLRAVRHVLDDLRVHGKDVWLILHIPTGGTLGPMQGIRRSFLGGVELRDPALDRRKLDQRWGPLKAKLTETARSAGARVLDPMDWLCDAQVCRGRLDDGRLMYKDASHLRASIVEELATFIDAVLDPEGHP